MNDATRDLRDHIAHANANGDPHVIAALEAIERILADLARRLKAAEEAASE